VPAARRRLIACALAATAMVAAIAAAADDRVARGAYLLRGGGCVACHTDFAREGEFLAGGGPIKTPFGTFYAPNITPDPDHGVGAWRETDFVTAMTRGVAPDGGHYYPVFPYAAYTKIGRVDLADLWAYLKTVPPVARPRRQHDLRFPFSMRLANLGWKWLYFKAGPFRPDPGRAPEWNRGAYLVEALGHCGECHTPRTRLGGLDRALTLAGTRDGPEESVVPNITPDAETGLGDWSETDIAWLLKTGFMPDGDDVQEGMGDVVEHGTSHLADADLRAIAVYLKSLPPIHNRVRKERDQDGGADEDW
jgi:mono/diheme cytochrome c family protein